MTFDRLQRILVWLLIIAASAFLLERLLVVVRLFATPLLLFALAWLFALALRPIVDGMTRVELPIPFISRHSSKTGVIAPTWRLPRSVAVLLVYVALLAVLVTLVVLLVPVVVPQIARLQETLPAAGNEILLWSENFEADLNRLGLRVNLNSVVRPEALAEQATALGSEIVKQSLTIAGGIASLLINLIFVLILSFYMALDGPRLAARTLNLLPAPWRDEVQTFFLIVDRTFGGFLRAQLVQALIYGLATAMLMVGLGLSDVALASLLAGILVLIPLIGGVFAMVPPLLIALIQSPDKVFWTFMGLIIVQQVLFNMIMPRLMGQIVGLHPLLVFAAILVGGTLAGAWGILFGIPIAGVIASVLQFFYVRATTDRARAEG